MHISSCKNYVSAPKMANCIAKKILFEKYFFKLIHNLTKISWLFCLKFFLITLRIGEPGPCKLFRYSRRNYMPMTTLHDLTVPLRIFSNFNILVLLLHSPLMRKNLKYTASDWNMGTWPKFGVLQYIYKNQLWIICTYIGLWFEVFKNGVI